MLKTVVILACLIPVLGFCGDAEKKPGAKSKPASMEELDNSNKLKAGDRISIEIAEDEHQRNSLLIQQDGNVNFPFLGSRKAEGLTPKEFALMMKKDLEKTSFLRATVLVKLETPLIGPIPVIGCPGVVPSFTVFGDVARQGRCEMPKDKEFTLADALAMTAAGGFRLPTKAVVVRKTPDGEKRIEVNLRNLFKEGIANSNIPIQAGDVIIIPGESSNF